VINKLVDVLHLQRSSASWLNAQVYFTLVDCNPLTPLLRFVLDLLYKLFLHCYAAVGTILTDTSWTHRVAWFISGSRASRSWLESEALSPGKMTARCNSWRGPNTVLIHTFSKVRGDTSHRVPRVVAPMIGVSALLWRYLGDGRHRSSGLFKNLLLVIPLVSSGGRSPNPGC